MQSIYTDSEGYFGPSGETEWMAFVKDPSGNLVGLVERKIGEPWFQVTQMICGDSRWLTMDVSVSR